MPARGSRRASCLRKPVEPPDVPGYHDPHVSRDGHDDAGAARRCFALTIRDPTPGRSARVPISWRTALLVRRTIMTDHRQLGRELGIFDSDPLIGAGLPLWLPAGAAARYAV